MTRWPALLERQPGSQPRAVGAAFGSNQDQRKGAAFRLLDRPQFPGAWDPAASQGLCHAERGVTAALRSLGRGKSRLEEGSGVTLSLSLFL